MNVVAKSTNVSPILKSVTTVVTNGGRPVPGSGTVLRSKIVVKPVVSRMLNESLSESLLSGPLRVTSGITGSKPSIILITSIFNCYFKKLRFCIFRLYNRILYSHGTRFADHCTTNRTTVRWISYGIYKVKASSLLLSAFAWIEQLYHTLWLTSMS